MGIESDQLVYDYLSRVGDLAQQQQLSSGTRMRLVAELRGEIDRQRGKQSADSPAAVRRIIGKLGTPDELVAAAAASADGTVELPDRTGRTGRTEQPGRSASTSTSTPTSTPADAGSTGSAGSTASAGRVGEAAGKPGAGPDVPRPRTSFDPRTSLKGVLRKAGPGKDAPRPRAEKPGPEPGADAESGPDSGAPGTAAGQVPSPPHRAGTDELGPSGSEPDWWRIEPGPFGDGVDVPGFVGGVEIPAMLKPPAPKDAVPAQRAGTDEALDDEGAAAEDDAPEADEAPPKRRRPPGLRRRAPRAPREEGASGRGFSHPLLLLAAALLVVGAALGNWLGLAGGWLLAYSSRTLSRTEAKWAAMGLPGVVAAGAVVWLWGRTEGRWGEPVPRGGMDDVLSGMWPVVVRTAALASAAFLVWRARKRTE
ncbi:hypothetical protein ACWCXX_02730 [Streptomyces sp. NPDC001732]